MLQGRAAGERAYGYRTTEGETGLRRLDDTEAAVVRRIYKLFADGAIPRAIARKLNAEQVPGPDGRPWQDTAIRGQGERGTGILNTELYVGQPELRFVDDELWQSVKRRQEELSFAVGRDEDGHALNRAHRRRFLLSRLLVCSVCGGGYTIMAKDRYGCAGHRSKGICGNDRTIARQAIETRVLMGLKHHLLAPDLFEAFARAYQEAFARAYQEECAKRMRELGTTRAGLESRLAQVERKIAATIRAIEDGLYQPIMRERMVALEAEKARLVAELAAKPDAAPVALHPNLPVLYRKKVEELEAVLADPELGAEAMEAIRAMITRIVLTPGADGGMEAVLEGDLARILAICEDATNRNARRMGGRSSDVPMIQVSVVAGAGFEPATFRL